MELLDRGVGGVVVGYMYCANCPCACRRLASAVIKVWPSAPILLLVFCEPPNPRHPQQLTHAMNHTWRAYRGSSSTKPAWTPCVRCQACRQPQSRRGRGSRRRNDPRVAWGCSMAAAGSTTPAKKRIIRVAIKSRCVDDSPRTCAPRNGAPAATLGVVHRLACCYPQSD